MKLSISLNKPKATKPEPPPIQRPSAFSLGDDDEPNEIVPTPTTGNKAGPHMSSKSMKKRMEAEKQVDATVYEYDEVWDRMQAAKEKQKVAKEAESSVRKVITAIIIAVILRTHTVFTA
jgi:coiled-coil domain-containing protein 55